MVSRSEHDLQLVGKLHIELLVYRTVMFDEGNPVKMWELIVYPPLN
jgi:hypothetical protein